MFYIIHYKKLTDRKDYLINKLNSFNLEYHFIEQYDRETISNNLVNKFYKVNPTLWEKRIKGLYINNIGFRELKLSEICNSLSHLDALKKISDSEDDYAIIIEDDVIFNNDFNSKLENLIKQTPEDFDVIFFGSAFNIFNLDKSNLSKTIKIKNNIYKKIPAKTRCVDGYVIKKELAKKLYEEIKEIVLPFDFELNYFFNKLNPNCYWLDPGLIKQGSMVGIYKSANR